MVLLLITFVGASGLCVWAIVTGAPDPETTPRPVRTRFQHTQALRGETTRRLYPPRPSDAWLAPRERPGGEEPIWWQE
jgi:hypothetical protein